MNKFSEMNAFISVVETGGFSAAARKTGESQSAISKAVNSLEKRLGVALLHRSTRKVTLTDQGQKYYERTKPLDRKSVVSGKSVSVRVDLGGRRIIKKKKNRRARIRQHHKDKKNESHNEKYQKT